MKIKISKKKILRALFALCCVAMAFAFWFIVTYNNLGN